MFVSTSKHMHPPAALEPTAEVPAITQSVECGWRDAAWVFVFMKDCRQKVFLFPSVCSGDCGDPRAVGPEALRRLPAAGLDAGGSASLLRAVSQGRTRLRPGQEPVALVERPSAVALMFHSLNGSLFEWQSRL